MGAMEGMAVTGVTVVTEGMVKFLQIDGILNIPECSQKYFFFKTHSIQSFRLAFVMHF